MYSSEEKQNENLNGIFDIRLVSVFDKYLSLIKNVLNLTDDEFSKINKIFINNNNNKYNEEIEFQNFSYEIMQMEKSLKKDIFISETTKFIKIVNLLIKYTDNTVIELYFKNYLEIIETRTIHKYESISNYKLKLKMIIEDKNFFTKNNFIFKSSYLTTLENFFLEKIKNDSIINNKTIIFLNKRIITKYLSETLNNFLNVYGYETTFVVGTAKQSSLSFTEEELNKNIKSFKDDQKFIGLFATNVVEEGIDIPLCDNIINLCAIKTMRELIQKSGRARKSNSIIYTCCENNEDEKKYTLQHIENLKNSIEVMKDVIVNDTIIPKNFNSEGQQKDRKMENNKLRNEYINNIDYYETPLGARVYLSYAKSLVNHFIGKLFSDGFTYLRAEMKIHEDKENGCNYYKAYLSLPSCLEEEFTKIFDSDINLRFGKKEEAEKYCKSNEEYFYLKAVKYLHRNQYLDDYLCFIKNYDDLINLDYNYASYKNEPKVSLIQNEIQEKENSTNLNFPNEIINNNLIEKEYFINIVEYDPRFIDLNLMKRFDCLNNGKDIEKEKLQKLAIISEFKISDLDFNIFIPATQILHLYWINQNVIDPENEYMENLNLPKIEYKYFSKMNFQISGIQQIKLNNTQKNLVEFYYVYSMFFSTDAEIAFYYMLLQNKFSFTNELFFKDNKTQKYLEIIFKKIKNLSNENILNFPFLDQENNDINFNHLIKIAILKGNYKNGFEIDFEEIETTLENVKKEIKKYYFWLKEYIISDEKEIQKLLEDSESIDEKASSLCFYNPEDVKTRRISRNFLNFSKLYVCNYSEKNKRGNMLINQATQNNNQNKYKRKGNKIYSDEETYQSDYLKTYGLITEGSREFLKTYCFDFNQRMLRYKINIKNLGRVHLNSKRFYIKKFKFLPLETVYEIENCTIDKIFLFGMIPTILYKLQHDLIYYYQAIMLKNRFTSSFGTLQSFKMNLLIEALNSKSTLESQNYERLEFLGDSVLKFLSSWETFVKYPNANRDLLYSKRRNIESNKNLFVKAIEKNNNLNDFLYSSPINFKRMNIKGFTQNEMFLFNIGLNRSFAKKSLLCFGKKDNSNFQISEENNEKELDNKGNNDLSSAGSKINSNEDKNLILNNNNENIDNQINKDNDFTNIDLVEEENIDTDKTLLDVNHYIVSKEMQDDCSESELSYQNSDRNFIKIQDLEEFVDKNLNVVPGDNKPSRIISNKVLADFVESLTGYLFYMNFNLFFNRKSDNFFSLSSEFLLDIGILESEFNLHSMNQFWLKDLENPKCKYNMVSKLNKFACLNSDKYHVFNNVNLLFQALSHPESIINKDFAYVNRSYQRLAFLGEAFLSFFVTFYVYDNNPDINECMLHKLKICGINHHIISQIAIEMKLHDLLLISYRSFIFI